MNLTELIDLEPNILFATFCNNRIKFYFEKDKIYYEVRAENSWAIGGYVLTISERTTPFDLPDDYGLFYLFKEEVLKHNESKEPVEMFTYTGKESISYAASNIISLNGKVLSITTNIYPASETMVYEKIKNEAVREKLLSNDSFKKILEYLKEIEAQLEI